MSQNSPYESAWFEVQREAAAIWSDGNHRAALNILDDFLSSSLPDEVQREVLAFKGSVLEDGGEIQEAKTIYLAAHSLSSRPTYSRFTIELALGALCEKNTSLDEAISWYRAALITSMNSEEVSGGPALINFLKLRGESHLTEDEKELCSTVALRSWRLLAVPGTPDLSQLTKVAGTLVRAGGGWKS